MKSIFFDVWIFNLSQEMIFFLNIGKKEKVGFYFSNLLQKQVLDLDEFMR